LKTVLFRLGLGLMIIMAIASAPLLGQQITGPTGTVAMGSTVQLSWPPTLWSGNPLTVDIRLSHGTVITSLIPNAPNNGHASIVLPLPPTLPCNPSEMYWFTVGPSGATTTKFTMSCPPPPTGSLNIMKTVVNLTGGVVPAMPASFGMSVDCTPARPTNKSIITVTTGGAGTPVAAIAAGSSCRVAEKPPATILRLEGCKGGSATWTTTILPAMPVIIVAGVTTKVTVTNTLKCDKR